MPPSHKHFIESISSRPSLRNFVLRQADEHLTHTFDQCLSRLVEFRNYHINIVTRYVTIPASRAKLLRVPGQESSEEFGMIGKAPIALEERGTGGSGIMSFLKRVRDQTKYGFISQYAGENQDPSVSTIQKATSKLDI